MSVAKKLAPKEACLETGLIERTTGTLQVVLASGSYEARRAKSCLVAPELGDRVLCAIEQDAVFVLAVLEGREGAATRLTAEGDLRLQAPAGRVSVCSGKGVDIIAAEDVAVTTHTVNVRAKHGSVAVDELGYLGKLVRVQVGKVALFAEEIDSRMTRLTQRAKRVFRFVEDLDQTRAGTVDMRAESLAALRGENTMVTARVLAKIDGQQVHIG
ncbi:MAG: DUF3540 domain-containing protein [Deltaproteobacteria bacterium]|nr:DUF3540 domain-containing protein [Deltaproteobacteria bacterium]